MHESITAISPISQLTAILQQTNTENTELRINIISEGATCARRIAESSKCVNIITK